MKKTSAIILIISFITIMVLGIVKIVTNTPNNTIFLLVMWSLVVLCILSWFNTLKS